jgi:hypothetical protein
MTSIKQMVSSALNWTDNEAPDSPISIAERLRSSDDPLGEVYGWAPLNADRLSKAIKQSDEERAECILRLAETDDFYALVAHVLTYGMEGVKGMESLRDAIRVAIRAAEAQKKLIEQRQKARLSFKDRAFERIGFRPHRRQPWAGYSTAYTPEQLAEIKRRSTEGGDDQTATA